MNDIIKKLELFKNVIGQEPVKRELGFYLDSYQATRISPNLIFSAAKGQGKTTIAKEYAKGLTLFDEKGKLVMEGSKVKRKPFVEVNCSTLKNVKQFINGLVVPYVQDKDVTLLFDEASELPHDISMALLTILNPNPENRTTFALDEYVCDFDFRKQTFLFATSEVQGVFHALIDRLERITLSDYTPANLAAIVKKGLCPKGETPVECKDKVLDDVSSVLRGNARAAQKMASKIMAYLRNKKVFVPKDWEELKDILGIYPLGLNAVEISILDVLKKNPDGTSLTRLSATTGMSREALARDSELYLQKMNLMQIETAGRKITTKGLEYLKGLKSVA